MTDEDESTPNYRPIRRDGSSVLRDFADGDWTAPARRRSVVAPLRASRHPTTARNHGAWKPITWNRASSMGAAIFTALIAS